MTHNNANKHLFVHKLYHHHNIIRYNQGGGSIITYVRVQLVKWIAR